MSLQQLIEQLNAIIDEDIMNEFEVDSRFKTALKIYSYKSINEKLEFVLNEISDKTKQSLLAKRTAQANQAQNKLARAKELINRSKKEITQEHATNALKSLQAEMKKLFKGKNWSLYYDEDSNEVILYVSSWGNWEVSKIDEPVPGYNYPLEFSDEQKLDEIIDKVEKDYNVEIQWSEEGKDSLSFIIQLEDKDKILYEKAVDYLENGVFPVSVYSHEMMNPNNYDTDIDIDEDMEQLYFHISMDTSDGISCVFDYSADSVDLGRNKKDILVDFMNSDGDYIADYNFTIPDDIEALDIIHWLPLLMRFCKQCHKNIAMRK